MQRARQQGAGEKMLSVCAGMKAGHLQRNVRYTFWVLMHHLIDVVTFWIQ